MSAPSNASGPHRFSIQCCSRPPHTYTDCMPDLQQLELALNDTLGLLRRPVAIQFRETAPDGIPKFEGMVPSGCLFWKLASEGRTFYTVPGDHYNCPVGSYTHNMPPPPGRESELPELLNVM